MRPSRLMQAAFAAALLTGIYGAARAAPAPAEGAAAPDQATAQPAPQSGSAASSSQAGSQAAGPGDFRPGMRGGFPHGRMGPGYGPGMMGYGPGAWAERGFAPGMREDDAAAPGDGYGMWGFRGPAAMDGGPGPRGGYGPDMWDGYGPGMMAYGPGMMGSRGPHRPGWFGPGMMWGYPPGMMGYGPGMMGGPYGPWMMQRWMGAGAGCGGWADGGLWAHPRPLNLSVQDVRDEMQRWLDWHRNPHLKLGAVKEQNADSITAEIVTQDNSLVRRFDVDRHTGRFRPVDE